MKLFVVAVLIGFASAARLDTSYLPPNSASSAGGSGNFLRAPIGRPQSPHSQYSLSGSTQTFGTGGGQHQGYGGGAVSVTGFGGYSGGATQYSAGPATPPIPILNYVNNNNGDGSYNFEYATGNGIMQQEQGYLNNPGSENAEQVVTGSYSYTGDDGKTYTVQYKADANGFQAYGDHLPTPPPIPEAIQKSLAYNAANGGNQNVNYLSGQGGRPQQQYLPPNRQQSYNPNTGYQY